MPDRPTLTLKADRRRPQPRPSPAQRRRPRPLLPKRARLLAALAAVTLVDESR